MFVSRKKPGRTRRGKMIGHSVLVTGHNCTQGGGGIWRSKTHLDLTGAAQEMGTVKLVLLVSLGLLFCLVTSSYSGDFS